VRGIRGVTVHKSPEEPPHPHPRFRKPTPSSRAVGSRREARQCPPSPDARSGLGPLPTPPPPLPTPGAVRREPVNRVGAELGSTATLSGKARVCKARHRSGPGQSECLGSL
jgi:hypothetical protein